MFIFLVENDARINEEENDVSWSLSEMYPERMVTEEEEGEDVEYSQEVNLRVAEESQEELQQTSPHENGKCVHQFSDFI